ncbi:hypothetical protein F5J12DRAFT_779165 [Pisolithus orientalis]|uniref:uncharacterized protein n=1 Tax=Pisolithus orientalis TaxID=936130 RepID=UPI002225AE8E|nr:uncharacterized protein F5J12DRAFT_779165 [Pisolithus orientalis]KAI6032718.1 hypothetical protein F5J12DRAFT_779165 [Pisolithus orientalis]
MNHPSIEEVDRVLHEHSLGEMWYRSLSQFNMEGDMKTLDVARRPFNVMVDFYDPVEDEDPDCKHGDIVFPHLLDSNFKQLDTHTKNICKAKAQGGGDDNNGGGHHGGGVSGKHKGGDKGKG